MQEYAREIAGPCQKKKEPTVKTITVVKLKEFVTFVSCQGTWGGVFIGIHFYVRCFRGSILTQVIARRG